MIATYACIHGRIRSPTCMVQGIVFPSPRLIPNITTPATNGLATQEVMCRGLGVESVQLSKAIESLAFGWLHYPHTLIKPYSKAI